MQVSVFEDGKFEESLIASVTVVDDGDPPSVCKVVLHICGHQPSCMTTTVKRPNIIIVMQTTKVCAFF